MAGKRLISHDEARQKKWADPGYRREYRRLKPRYDVVRQLLNLRQSRGFTQADLADKANTHQSRVSRIESADDDFRISTLVSMAEALGADVEIRLVPRPSRETYAAIVADLVSRAVDETAEAYWQVTRTRGFSIKEEVFG